MTTANIQDNLLLSGGKIWEKESIKRIYLTQELVNKCDLGISFNDKKHKLFFDCNTSTFGGSSNCFVSALNANIK